MKSSCRFCGASVTSSAKICPGCGKLLPAYRGVDMSVDKKKTENDTGLTPNARVSPKNTYASMRSGTKISDPDADYGKKSNKDHSDIDYMKTLNMTRSSFMTASSSGKLKNRSIFASGFGKLLRWLFLICVAAAIYIAMKITVVMTAGYNFKTGNIDEVLPNHNYREAISCYFDEGHWWFDIGSNRVMYIGTDRRGDELKLYFEKYEGQMTVTQLYVNDKRIIGIHDIMYKYIVVMFRTPKTRNDAPTATGGGVTDF